MTEFELRKLALDYAMGHLPHCPHPDLKSPDGIVKAAGVFEAYLRGPVAETPAAITAEPTPEEPS